MKKIIFLLAIISFSTFSYGQMKDPVRWSFSAKKISDKTYEIHLNASMDQGWHIYSQTTPDGGPIPTTVNFLKNPLVTMNGNAKESGKLEERYEPLFGVNVKQFSDKVVFIQTVVLKVNAKTALNGTVEFMACNDKECLPPKTVKFSVNL
ncbi:MAG: protein-disulfide reductase DsbD family protein [Chitinophagaceae bacterium]|nr:protein-disulfide reductase DsbD family protein [Chitinophagaceae bacterium]